MVRANAALRRTSVKPSEDNGTAALPGTYRGSITALALVTIEKLLDDHNKGNLHLPRRTQEDLSLDKEELTSNRRYGSKVY